MRQLVIGILAHVDAGKTTLSEAMLYLSGARKKLGRVDHADAFLDHYALERQRGITIFSKQAVIPLPGLQLTLLDTPGHVDFSAEMERTLQVLDCAVLVVSGTDGVQNHTATLARLLERYRVPTILFVNKMDLPGAGREALMEQLRDRLGEGCVDFTHPGEEQWQEELAVRDEGLMESYLAGTPVSDADAARLVAGRQVFPCLFGSALRLEGVDALLSALERFVPQPVWGEKFGALVYKIARDAQGQRLTYLKVTGGALHVKDVVHGEDWEEKADQLRLYSGDKFTPLEEAPAGSVCAVTGLSRTRPGQALGAQSPAQRPVLEPVLHYQVLLPDGTDPHTALQKLRQLEEEDPQLHLVWNEALGQIHIQLMGEVQLEVLSQLARDRFGFSVAFDQGGIVYKETLTAPVEGVGHFEPLRHYAEVHLLLSPGEPGSGIVVDSRCSEDLLDGNWQRLILTHLEERTHPGVLTGSAVTDLHISLLSGRAHPKHTEGGDFRQATYRAVRQGLRRGESVLLEPWYTFRLELPGACLGRAMADVQRMSGQFDPPENHGDTALLTGSAPVSAMRGYQREVAAYSRGEGRLSCTLKGYFPCHDAPQVIEALGYDCDGDTDNPCSSVFCSHGAGFVVPWDQVEEYMHLPYAYQPSAQETPSPVPSLRPREVARPAQASDEELQAIFERTYGKVERTAFQPPKKPARTSLDEGKYNIRSQKTGPEYLLVDGYNIIFAWEELQAVARENVDAARQLLLDILADYRGFRKCEVILVFDAYKVKGNPGSVKKYKGVYVVYTKEAETADSYIEKATYDLGRDHRVRVATSDYMEQLIILGHGALRLSARTFHEEVEQAQGEIRRLIQAHNAKNRELDRLDRRATVIRDK